MKVFISWSGKFSKECAELLRDWVKCTLQASEPWISSKDIDKGSLWFNEINDELKDTSVGIVCLTKDNKEKPWILFEAGALAKGLSANRVCTFLIDLKPAYLDNPLAQFNHTIPDKEGMKSLLTTINKELGEDALEARILDQVFDTYWISFESQFNDIMSSATPANSKEPTRSKDDILEEILYTTRTMDRRIRSLERHSSDKRYARPGRLPRQEVEHLIKEMLSSGDNPDEVLETLQGVAPSSFLHEQIRKQWESMKSLLTDCDENA